MRHIIPISGKDSLTTAIVQMNRNSDLSYEFIFNDVGSELPETYEWLDSIEDKLDIKITRIGESLSDIIAFSGFLPSQQKRYCTRLAKIEPMEKFIGTDEAIIYIGLRSDESSRIGFVSNNKKIKPVYPLVEMNININLVYKILSNFNLEPPIFFWEDMYNRVISKLDKEIVDNLPKQIFNVLFAWRSRPNCFYCFNQRLYEWVGLYEHHQDKFNEAYQLEIETGASYYTFYKNESLVSIIQRSEEIKEKRARKIVEKINLFRNMKLFDEEDLFALKSCGFLCGK